MSTGLRSTLILPVLFILAIFGLTACDVIRDVGRQLSTSTIIYYTPITFCNGLFAAEGSVYVDGEPVLVEEVFVYRLDAIENNQTSAISLYPRNFYLRLSDARLASRAAQLLTTIPSSITASPDARIESPGLVAMRYRDAERAELIEPVSGSSECGTDLCYRVLFPPLQYAPGLRDEPRPYVGINTRGKRTRIVDPSPCRLDEVIALAASTR